jgi:hypothetical protein
MSGERGHMLVRRAGTTPAPFPYGICLTYTTDACSLAADAMRLCRYDWFRVVKERRLCYALPPRRAHQRRFRLRYVHYTLVSVFVNFFSRKSWAGGHTTPSPAETHGERSVVLALTLAPIVTTMLAVVFRVAVVVIVVLT